MDNVIQYAVSYARVSTEDQARKDLSVPAQFRRMDDFALRNNIQIVYRDADEGVSAFKDNENREGFWRTVDHACQDPRVTLFLVDDAARFFRDKYLAVETKARLRRHGVRVLITSNPYDPATIHGVWQEAIDEARSQTSSMETAFYTFRGQEQNAQTRDPETGWCYKNGGRAPFGYRTIRVVRGRDSRGRDIKKALWEIDEEAAEVMRFMYRRRAEGASYKNIQREMNEAGLLSPSGPGRPWTISSIIEMMREDRVLQCAGVYFWNKEDHKTPGRRFKPKSEWLRVDNAHPAIITKEEAEAVITVNKQRSRDNTYSKTAASPYWLTGKNALGEDMFICTACGARMTSHKPALRSRNQYICGNVHYRGKTACIPGKSIDKEWIEGFLVDKIRELYGTREAANKIAAKVNEEIMKEYGESQQERNYLIRQLNTVEKKIKNLLSAIAEGLDFEEAKDEVKRLKSEQAEIKQALDNLATGDIKKPRPITAEEIMGLYENLRAAIEAEDAEKKRKFIRVFVRRLEYDPKEDLLRIYFFGPNRPSSLVVPGSVCKLDGAQDRT